MLTKRHLLLAALGLCLSCSDSSSDPQPKDIPTSEPQPVPVTPVTFSLPAAYFTEVEKMLLGSSSTIIMDRLVELVNATPEGASLHMAIYLFDYKELRDALLRADKRGVKLYLLLDRSREDSEYTNPSTINYLQQNLSSHSQLVVMDSDAGNTSINHNKFVLFSEVQTATGKQEHLVLQTSHNFIYAGTKKLQDALLLPNVKLYSAYKTNWQDMSARASGGMKQYMYTEFTDAESGITALFLPKRKEGAAYGEDSTIELLNGITDPAATTVRIGMSDWTAARLNIVQRLRELQTQGLKIEVICKSKADAAVLDGLRELEQHGAYLKVFNMSEPNQLYVNIHSKIMLLEGQWKGQETKLLVTGSHNFTGNALRYNNEIILMLQDSPFYGNYLSYFNSMKALPGLE